SAILEEVKRQASRRNLDLIGPDRNEVISYEIGGSGMVWSLLRDRDEGMDLIAGYTDKMIDPDGDLSKIADEMADSFINAVKEQAEEAEGTVFAEFFERFEKDIRSLVREKEVLPTLEDMRGALLERLDG